MEYAIDLLMPIMMGLWGGLWACEHWHWPSITPVLGAMLGMMAGLGILYKRSITPKDKK